MLKGIFHGCPQQNIVGQLAVQAVAEYLPDALEKIKQLESQVGRVRIKLTVIIQQGDIVLQLYGEVAGGAFAHMVLEPGCRHQVNGISVLPHA